MKNFALALLDLVIPADATTPSGAKGTTPDASRNATVGGTANEAATLRSAIATSATLGEQPRRALLALIDSAAGDLAQTRENIEEWYNNSMERVTGWYKRRTQGMLLVLALIVVGLVNADSIAVFKSLATDPVLRNTLITAAAEYAKADPSVAQEPATPSTSPSDCANDPRSPECRIEQNLQRIRSYGLPIGWDAADVRAVPTSAGAWVLKGVGWLITAIALSLGAAFWFDVLNKFMTARAALKPQVNAKAS